MSQHSLQDRDVVFVSHANPEDNPFATWLTLRLTREGYRAWCDIANLLGGDDFWKDIERVLRERTRKFIYVTSRVSNHKPGALKELALAEAIAKQLGDERFIIPVKIDDLPYAEHNIQINRLNAINFHTGWEGGLIDLLRSLERESVAKPEASGSSLVASWWNENRLNRDILKHTPESVWSNWFRINNLPEEMYVWEMPRNQSLPESFDYPSYRIGTKLISYADAEELTGKSKSLTGGRPIAFLYKLGDEIPKEVGLKDREIKTAIRQLLIQSWYKVAEVRGLPLYNMSSNRRTLWFPVDSSPGGMITFDGVDGNKSRRWLYGYKTQKQPTGERRKRYWHFGLEASPVLFPTLALSMKSHVIFSLNGKTAIEDVAAQHRARRSQCKLWWNDKWRDMTLAAVKVLGGEEGKICLPLKPESNTTIGMRPVVYQANIGYDDALVKSKPAVAVDDDSEPEVDEDNSDDEVE